MPTVPKPLRVAISNDYAIVVRGLHAMLEPFADRVEIVELDSRMPVLSDVDIVLYDSFSQPQGDRIELGRLARGDAKVVVYSWNVQPQLVRDALRRGVSGYLAKSLGAEKIVDALERVAAGEVVTTPGPGVDAPVAGGDWPGREQGLTERESEIVTMIAQGLSNQEIADRAYLSINSVKTYIRAAYKKMDVTRRSQAVRWAITHGFLPDHLRIIGPGDDERTA
jgi:NarL family two-component system response regulator LiaR